MTEQRKNRLKKLLQQSRYRLMTRSEELAAPLKDMLFVATKDVWHMSTNGACIYFDPDWLQRLGNTELDFILSHQLMHIALGHIERPKYYKGDRFHLACDIVANSQLELLDWKYDMLPGIGRIFHETFFPKIEGHQLTAQEALECIPFDPAVMKPGKRRGYMIDAETWWDRKDDRGESGVIVLSPGEEDPKDRFFEQKYTPVNRLLIRREQFQHGKRTDVDGGKDEDYANRSRIGWDVSASETLLNLRTLSKQSADAGIEDDFVERAWQRANSGKLDWRKLLSSFVQEEVCDYSFTPPDRRSQDSDFFLPDYNVLTERPKQVLFMADTSGSIDDDMLSMVYGEICSALAQFNGGLVGMLVFFDTRVYTPVGFSDVSDLLKIKPCGGGGTDFSCIFDYLKKHMADASFADIVIFTDGQAEFPNESAAGNIPVLWLLTDKSVTPPWGKFAYV